MWIANKSIHLDLKRIYQDKYPDLIQIPLSFMFLVKFNFPMKIPSKKKKNPLSMSLAILTKFNRLQ